MQGPLISLYTLCSFGFLSSERTELSVLSTLIRLTFVMFDDTWFCNGLCILEFLLITWTPKSYFLFLVMISQRSYSLVWSVACILIMETLCFPWVHQTSQGAILPLSPDASIYCSCQEGRCLYLPSSMALTRGCLWWGEEGGKTGFFYAGL